MKKQLFIPILSVAVLLVCNNQSAIAQDGCIQYKMDRTVLPIQPPTYAPIEVLDARDAKKPPMFQIKPPEGAPTSSSS